MKRERKYKWVIYGENGNYFTNLKDAKKYAKELSTQTNDEVSIALIEEGCYYIDYSKGKCVRDGWTRK